MKNNKIVLILMLVFILTFVIGCNKKNNEEVVATVDGIKITKEELDKKVTQSALINNYDINSSQFEQMEDYFRLQILENMIDEILLKNAAQKRGLKVTKEDVESEFNNLKKQFKSEDEFKKYFFDQLKLTEKEIKNVFETQLLILALYEDVVKNADYTEKDLKNY